MNNREIGALYGTFIGDAMALGPHWEYNTLKLNWKYKEFSSYPSCKRSLYHSKKEAGMQTHYGDQMHLLLKYMSESETFEISRYKDLWLELFKDYPHYKDHATKDSLKVFEAEDTLRGADSKDFAGPAMKAFMMLDDRFDLKTIESVMGVSHNYEGSLEHLKLFKKLYQGALNNIKPSEVLKDYKGPEDLMTWLEAARKQADKPAIKAVKKLGQSCSTKSAFPSVFYLLVKYEDSFEEAIVNNIRCGGDQAARGILLGFVLGALHGLEGIPKKWVEDLHCKATLDVYIELNNQK